MPMQRWTWTLALVGLFGGLGVTNYLQSDGTGAPPDPTQVMLQALQQHVERLEDELEVSRTQVAQLSEEQAETQALGQRMQRLEAELSHSGEKFARQREVLGQMESSTREAALQAIGVEFTGFAQALDTKWEGLRGQVDEVYGLARQHEGTLRELSQYRQRDTTRMWTELLGPTVQLSGESTVGSGVLLPSVHVEGDEYRTYLLTAWHVVRDIQTDPRQPNEPVPVRIYHADGTRSDETARLLIYDSMIDSALLVMNTEKRFDFGAQLSSREKLGRIAIFSHVYAVGCPLGNDPIPTFGEIADIRHQVDGEPYWMISAPTYIGNSGGGIFDAESNELIGLFSKIYTHGTLRPTVVPHMGLVTPLTRVYDWLTVSGYGDLVPTDEPATPVNRDSLLQTQAPRHTDAQQFRPLDTPAPRSASLDGQPLRD